MVNFRAIGHRSKAANGLHIQNAFVELVKSEPKSMPSWRVTDRFNEGWMRLNASRSPGSKTFNRSRSSFLDWLHVAAGGAYCDVFTCDKDTDTCLGDVRKELGLKRQLSPRGDVERFVKELTESC